MALMLSAAPSIPKAPFSGQRISTAQIRGSAVIPCFTQSSMSVSLSIEFSSRPKKKGTAHHNKTRPKKRQPYDKNRKGPTYYPSLPKPSQPQQDDQQPPSADAAPAASSSIGAGLPPATPVVAEEL